jgi:hypothetical protein
VAAAPRFFEWIYLSSKTGTCTGGRKTDNRGWTPDSASSVCNLLVSDHRGSHTTLMTYALDDLAVAVHLAQFALCFGGIATVNHQVVDDQANTRPDTEAIFRKYGRQHK